ncbi:sigma-70 family RNA polymerase sigma factor [Saccharopolyspora cebuensis]|uniref:sigma-70 family RNA polymerase sigma factor n=1 Tax=Saccharopolyspora cebuensis TaxID=418759 RepID=UPI0031EB7F3A
MDRIHHDIDLSGEGALDTARRAFTFLTTGPHPLALDGREFSGLPPRMVGLGEVRDRLLHRQCPLALRDRVWTHLVSRSRAEGGAWTVACAGVALPALTTIAARLSARFAADPADLHSAVLAGFLAGVAEIDLDRPGIMNRLRWAAFRAGHAALREALDAPAPSTETPTGAPSGDRARTAEEGHPDLVLASAVAAGVVTRQEAEVISVTRLDGHPLRRVAAERGVSYEALKKQRARAEHRLADHLQHHSEPPIGPGRRSRSVTRRQADRGEEPGDAMSHSGFRTGVQR